SVMKASVKTVRDAQSKREWPMSPSDHALLSPLSSLSASSRCVAGKSSQRHCIEIAMRIVALSLVGSLAGGCYGLERLRWVGDTPPLASIDNPTAKAGYKPVQMPMPAPQPAVYQPNSLWRTGSRAFFK